MENKHREISKIHWSIQTGKNCSKTGPLHSRGIIKSINQWYNKMRSHYYSALRNGKNEREGQFNSKKLIKLDNKRNNQIKDFFHKISSNIVKKAKEHKSDTIIIGKNDNWKQKVDLAPKTIRISSKYLIRSSFQ